MRAKGLFLILAVAAIILGPLMTHDASAAYIWKTLSNFDIKNSTGQIATDLDIILSGVTCNDITSWYLKGSSTRQMTCMSVGGGKIRVTFTGFSIPADQIAHFGLSFCPLTNPKVEKIYWTSGGNQLAPYVDFAGIQWVGSINCPVVMKFMRPDSSLTKVCLAKLRWAHSPSVIPLDNMTPMDPAITGLVWDTPSPAVTDTCLETVGEIVSFTTPPIGVDTVHAVLAKYVLVNSTGDSVGVFIQQAEVRATVPTLTEWGLIILAVLAVGAVIWTVVRRRRVLVPA